MNFSIVFNVCIFNLFLHIILSSYILLYFITLYFIEFLRAASVSLTYYNIFAIIEFVPFT